MDFEKYTGTMMSWYDTLSKTTDDVQVKAALATARSTVQSTVQTTANSVDRVAGAARDVVSKEFPDEPAMMCSDIFGASALAGFILAPGTAWVVFRLREQVLLAERANVVTFHAQEKRSAPLPPPTTDAGDSAAVEEKTAGLSSMGQRFTAKVLAALAGRLRDDEGRALSALVPASHDGAAGQLVAFALHTPHDHAGLPTPVFSNPATFVPAVQGGSELGASASTVGGAAGVSSSGFVSVSPATVNFGPPAASVQTGQPRLNDQAITEAQGHHHGSQQVLGVLPTMSIYDLLLLERDALVAGGHVPADLVDLRAPRAPSLDSPDGGRGQEKEQDYSAAATTGGDTPIVSVPKSKIVALVRVLSLKNRTAQWVRYHTNGVVLYGACVGLSWVLFRQLAPIKARAGGANVTTQSTGTSTSPVDSTAALLGSWVGVAARLATKAVPYVKAVEGKIRPENLWSPEEATQWFFYHAVAAYGVHITAAFAAQETLKIPAPVLASLAAIGNSPHAVRASAQATQAAQAAQGFVSNAAKALSRAAGLRQQSSKPQQAPAPATATADDSTLRFRGSALRDTAPPPAAGAGDFDEVQPDEVPPVFFGTTEERAAQEKEYHEERASRAASPHATGESSSWFGVVDSGSAAAPPTAANAEAAKDGHTEKTEGELLVAPSVGGRLYAMAWSTSRRLWRSMLTAVSKTTPRKLGSACHFAALANDVVFAFTWCNCDTLAPPLKLLAVAQYAAAARHFFSRKNLRECFTSPTRWALFALALPKHVALLSHATYQAAVPRSVWMLQLASFATVSAHLDAFALPTSDALLADTWPTVPALVCFNFVWDAVAIAALALNTSHTPMMVPKVNVFGRGLPAFAALLGAEAVVWAAIFGKALWRKRFTEQLFVPSVWQRQGFRGDPQQAQSEASPWAEYADAGGEFVFVE